MKWFITFVYHRVLRFKELDFLVMFQSGLEQYFSGISDGVLKVFLGHWMLFHSLSFQA